MIVDGLVYLPQALEPLTKENDGSYLPTPTAQTYGTQKAEGSAVYRPSLETMARKNLWPTPRANDAEKRGNFDEHNPRNGLPAAVKKWPTPRASEAGREPSKVVNRGNKTTLCEKIGGQLNPMWVEWLMGLPLGWTELKPWAMESFLSKSKRRLKN
jgi:hypothetical protein